MTPKIEQFACLHMPEISEPSQRAEMALPKGVKLQQMLESLQMPPADQRGALSKGQRRTRAITSFEGRDIHMIPTLIERFDVWYFAVHEIVHHMSECCVYREASALLFIKIGNDAVDSATDALCDER